MTQKELLVYGSIIVLALVGFKLKRSYFGSGVKPLPNYSQNSRQPPQDSDSPANITGTSNRPDQVTTKADHATTPPRVNTVPHPLTKEVERATANFAKTSGLKVATPAGMPVHQVNLGSGLTALIGRDSSSKTALSVIGYNKPVSSKEVMAFATSGDTDIPNLQGVNAAAVKSTKTVAAIPGSGLNDATLVTAKNSKGEDVYIAFAVRKDQKGTYMVVFSGPNKYFDSNDDLIEGLYNNMRAVDAPR